MGSIVGRPAARANIMPQDIGSPTRRTVYGRGDRATELISSAPTPSAAPPLSESTSRVVGANPVCQLTATGCSGDVGIQATSEVLRSVGGGDPRFGTSAGDMGGQVGPRRARPRCRARGTAGSPRPRAREGARISTSAMDSASSGGRSEIPASTADLTSTRPASSSTQQGAWPQGQVHKKDRSHFGSSHFGTCTASAGLAHSQRRLDGQASPPPFAHIPHLDFHERSESRWPPLQPEARRLRPARPCGFRRGGTLRRRQGVRCRGDGTTARVVEQRFHGGRGAHAVCH